LFARFKEPLLYGAISALLDCARVAGDAIEKPQYAAEAMHPVFARIKRALKDSNSCAANSEALSSAENFAILLKELFFYMSVHKISATTQMKKEIFFLQKACQLAPKLISNNRKAALEKINSHCHTAIKQLDLIGQTQNIALTGSFPENLKFSSIYLRLETIFSALQICALKIYQSYISAGEKK